MNEPRWIFVGCDFHPGFQQAAVIETEAGNIEERALTHVTVETELLYRMVARSVLLGWKPGNGQTSMLKSPPVFYTYRGGLCDSNLA